jgi:pimeloyl-ACP methyl ester carboxylesterase
MLILVHGYANPEARARKSYDTLVSRLRRSWPDQRLPEVWYFYWPGDLVAPGISQVSFSLQIRRAEQAGKLLAEWLYRRRADDLSPEAILVAHSLGCRLVLEALALLDARTKDSRSRHTHVARTCLMAAAVPVSLCQQGKLLGTRRDGRNELVLWSNRDVVLTWLFPIGEAAGLDRLARRSVGSTGQPEDRWQQPRRPSTGLGHGDYYGDQGTAHDIAGQLLRWRVPREPPVRTLAERRPSQPAHSLPESTLEARQLGEGSKEWRPA